MAVPEHLPISCQMIIDPACEKYTLPRQGIVNPIYLALLGSMFSMDLLDYFP